MNFSKALNIIKTDRSIGTKQSSISKIRAIKKIPYYIQLNAYEAAVANTNGRILFQINISLPSNFRIVEPIKQSSTYAKGLLTVKYRVGSTVYRYVIWGEYTTGEINDKPADIYSFPSYTNELIGKNCCFEFWGIERPSLLILRPTGIPDLRIKTSLVTDPSTNEQTEIVLNTGVLFTQAALGNALPEVVPTPQVDLAWLDNEI